MAPAALMVAAAGMQAGGQIYSGMAAAAEGKSAQNMAEYNAKLAEREAAMTEQKTAIEQRRQAGEAERRRSAMQAGMGAAGVVSTEGTPLLIQQTQAQESEFENMMIGYHGAEEAAALRSQATLQRLQGRQARQAGKAARMGSFIGAGGSLLSGFSQAADSGLFAKKTPSPFKVGTKTQLKNQTEALGAFYGY